MKAISKKVALTMKKNILFYRITDLAGDWFYYFAIVLIVYGIDKSTWVLGILSASYTLPGVLFSSILLKILRKRNQKNALVFQLIIRILCLIFITITKNIYFLLFLVFLEQVMTVGCNMNFQSIVVNVIHGDENLKRFNKNVTTYTNIFRLLVIPIYFLIENHIPIYLFMNIDIAMKLIAILYIVRIPAVGLTDLSEKANKGHKFSLAIVKSPLFKFILMMVAISYVVAFNSAYSISYINKITTKPDLIYACLTFLLALSDAIASFVSKRLIDFYENNKTTRLNRFLVTIILLCGALFAAVPIFKDFKYFIFVLTLIEFIYIFFQLFCLYLYQKSKNIMELVALQNTLVDAIAFFNSSVGALIIGSLGMNNYIELIGLLIMLIALSTFVKINK